MRKARHVGSKSRFAIGNVGRVKEACRARGLVVRIVHDPKDGEPAHSEIRRLPADDLILLTALAEEAFTRVVLNAGIPPESGE